MKIGVFGSTPRAVEIGRLLVGAGYHVCFGDTEGLKWAQAAADQAGGVADTPYNDAAVCEMLIFAGPREKADDLLARAGCISDHAVIVDAMEDPKPADPSGTEQLARKLNTHRVIRALIVAPEPGADIPYCGDDADAMTKMEEVFRTAGCLTTYRGPLAQASEIFPNGGSAAETGLETLKPANT